MRYLVPVLFLVFVCAFGFLRYERPHTWNRFVDAFRAPESYLPPTDTNAPAANAPSTNEPGTPPSTNPVADSTNASPAPSEAPPPPNSATTSHLKPVTPPEPPVITPKHTIPDIPRQ